MTRSKWRGWTIYHDGSIWRYIDNGQPVEGSDRPCGHCGKPSTPEGHDGCLGTLPHAMNACCGHGVERDAYIQYWDRSELRGRDAVCEQRRITGKSI